ncbi:hypothetical protein FIU93_16870 [Labrenzia sp. THAF35]|nr:hypothetical protein FIU93_16870 [Labrenzia sp. THAF35]
MSALAQGQGDGILHRIDDDARLHIGHERIVQQLQTQKIVVGFDIIRHNLDKIVDGTGDALARHDLGPMVDQLVEGFHVLAAGNRKLDERVGHEAKTHGLAVDDGSDLADDSLFLEALDPAPARRLAHARFLCHFGNGERRIPLQYTQNTYVRRVEKIFICHWIF